MAVRSSAFCIASAGLPHGAVRVHAALARHVSNETGYAFPGQERLAGRPPPRTLVRRLAVDAARPYYRRLDITLVFRLAGGG